MAYKSLILIYLIVSSSSWAASCCGGGGGALPLIVADNRSEFSISYSNKAYLYDVNPDGVVTKRDSDLQEVEETSTLAYSYLFDNYFQLSTQLGVMKITKKTAVLEESTTDLTSFTLSGAYEGVKEDYFSIWKPRVFSYLSISIPLGNSKHDSEETLQTDTTSSGFYTAKIGASAIKIIKDFDVSLDANFSVHKNQKFERISGEEVNVERKLSYSSSVDLGYNSSAGSSWRVGTTLSYAYTGKEIVTGQNFVNETSAVKAWTGSLSAAYMDEANNSYSISYADQTLFSESKNTSLGRSLSAKVSFKNPM
jgi:hypothetical protein